MSGSIEIPNHLLYGSSISTRTSFSMFYIILLDLQNKILEIHEDDFFALYDKMKKNSIIFLSMIIYDTA